MLAIRTDRMNWTDEKLIGQVENDVVLEMETAPQYDCIDISDGVDAFYQRCLPGKYGERLTYQEILHIRQFIDDVGDAENAMSLLMKVIDSQAEQLKETQDAIIELDGGV